MSKPHERNTLFFYMYVSDRYTKTYIHIYVCTYTHTYIHKYTYINKNINKYAYSILV